jgi:hypothetical protein
MLRKRRNDVDQGIVTKFAVKFHKQTDVWVCAPFIWSDCMPTILLQQAASLSFVGNLMEDAKIAFAKFLAREHDHKGAQQAQFIYINGTVRPEFTLIAWLSQIFPSS